MLLLKSTTLLLLRSNNKSYHLSTTLLHHCNHKALTFAGGESTSPHYICSRGRRRSICFTTNTHITTTTTKDANTSTCGHNLHFLALQQQQLLCIRANNIPCSSYSSSLAPPRPPIAHIDLDHANEESTHTTLIPAAAGKAPHGFWKDRSNHKRFFEWAALKLGVKQLDDWYNQSVESVLRLGGGKTVLGNYYNNSLSKALSSLYPDHDWKPWMFSKSPQGFWKHASNRRQFLDWAGKRLGVQRLDDWYTIGGSDALRSVGGHHLLDKYFKGSLAQALAATYPEHEWLPWRFACVPAGYWEDKANQRKFFDWAAKQLGVATVPEGWYGIAVEQVNALGGAGLLSAHYNSSLARALAAVYPEFEWLPWRFSVAPMGFFGDAANQRRFFEWAAGQLGVRQLDDWYEVTVADFCNKCGGAQLLAGYYNHSLWQALAATYPEHEWLPWRFKMTPSGFWNNKHNQRWFFDWAGKQLKLMNDNNSNSNNGNGNGNNNGSINMDMEAWYSVSTEDIRNMGGGRLVDTMYGGSLIAALLSVYPEYDWDPWRFERCRAFATNTIHSLGVQQQQQQRQLDESLRRFIEFLAAELHVERLNDWYRVSMDHVVRVCHRGGRGGSGHGRSIGGGWITRNGGLFAVLKRVYPEHNWDEAEARMMLGEGDKMRRHKRSSQWLLRVAVRNLFLQDGRRNATTQPTTSASASSFSVVN